MSKNYKLVASIHTAQIKSKGIIENVDPNISECIQTSSRKYKDGIITSTKINPNKSGGNVYKYSQFQDVFEEILKGTKIDNYTVARVDIRLDSFDAKHYKKYQKLHKYILSALAVTYSIQNTYLTLDLFTTEQRSIAIKNRRFEAEYYNKELQTYGTDLAKSRLELRSTSLNTKDILIVQEEWENRLAKARKNLDKVKQRFNNELEKIYKDNTNSKPTRFRNLTDFLIQYQDCFFDKAQLIDFLKRFPKDIKDPVIRAENHKKRYGLEYISNAQVDAAIQEIKRAIKYFFES